MTDLERITQSVEKRAEKICQVNDRVWEYAELAFHEFRSADTICQVLEEEGFTVERGLAGIPTCFTGTYVHGSGKPVMGILGEFDALSSLSQQAATTTPQPVVPGGAGHGCGHCSLGAGSLAAVLAIKDYLEQGGEETVKLGLEYLEKHAKARSYKILCKGLLKAIETIEIARNFYDDTVRLDDDVYDICVQRGVKNPKIESEIKQQPILLFGTNGCNRWFEISAVYCVS